MAKTRSLSQKSASYWWNSATTESIIASALSVLSKRYPALAGKRAGGTELVFEKGEEGACSALDEGNRIIITYGRPNMALRMVGNIISGVAPKAAEECPFTTLGIMLDCSRNAVMTVDHLKWYLERLAILGYNMAMLYTEDTYRIDGEPMFGFMRGRYTKDEIREIDDHAAALGIELVPCIQTLGHLDQIFKWGKYADIRDRDGMLLVDEKKTYALIEKMVAFWSDGVRSRRIHLGMDEAHGLGTGRHEEIYGKQSAFDIINRHLKKCCAICRKHGMKPMIWSDMYFRIGSRHSGLAAYYDLESQPPAEVVKGVPKGLKLVYWDYYHDDRGHYEKFIEKHRQIAGDPLMGSGVWTWEKFWYNHFTTRHTVAPCLEACRAKSLKEVFFTMWGDCDYCDCDSAFAGLAFAAELSFTGAADPDILQKRLSALFGASYMAVTALGEIIHMPVPLILFDDPLMLIFCRSFALGKTKFQDYDRPYSFTDVAKAFREVSKAISAAPSGGEAGSMKFAKALVGAVNSKLAYAQAAMDAAPKKDHRRQAPALLALARRYERDISGFYGEFCRMWHSRNKPFGLEAPQIRIGGQVMRARELVARLEGFIDSGERTIPELEELAAAGDAVDLGRWRPYREVATATCVF